MVWALYAPQLSGRRLPPCAQVLMSSMEDKPHVVYNVCSSIVHLAKCFDGEETSPLSPHFRDLVQSLLHVVQKHSGYENTKLQVRHYYFMSLHWRWDSIAALKLFLAGQKQQQQLLTQSRVKTCAAWWLSFCSSVT